MSTKNCLRSRLGRWMATGETITKVLEWILFRGARIDASVKQAGKIESSDIN